MHIAETGMYACMRIARYSVCTYVHVAYGSYKLQRTLCFEVLLPWSQRWQTACAVPCCSQSTHSRPGRWECSGLWAVLCRYSVHFANVRGPDRKQDAAAITRFAFLVTSLGQSQSSRFFPPPWKKSSQWFAELGLLQIINSNAISLSIPYHFKIPFWKIRIWVFRSGLAQVVQAPFSGSSNLPWAARADHEWGGATWDTSEGGFERRAPPCKQKWCARSPC